MIKRRKRQRSGIRDEDGPIRCPGHLKWVRGHECAIANFTPVGKSIHGKEWSVPHVCIGRIEAHHVREGANGGTGLKPDDSTAVPLCAHAHKRGHDKGWETFQKEWGIHLPSIAAEFWRKSPHRLKYEKERRNITMAG